MKHLSFPCWPFTANSMGQKLSPSTRASIWCRTLTLLRRSHWCCSVNSNTCFTDNMLVLFSVIHCASLDIPLYESFVLRTAVLCPMPEELAGELCFSCLTEDKGEPENNLQWQMTPCYPQKIPPNSILSAEWDTTHLETRMIWYVLPCSPNPFFYKYSERSERYYCCFSGQVLQQPKTSLQQNKSFFTSKIYRPNLTATSLRSCGNCVGSHFSLMCLFSSTLVSSRQHRCQHVSKAFVIRAIWFAKLHHRSETGSSTARSKWSL